MIFEIIWQRLKKGYSIKIYQLDSGFLGREFIAVASQKKLIDLLKINHHAFNGDDIFNSGEIPFNFPEFITIA